MKTLGPMIAAAALIDLAGPVAGAADAPGIRIDSEAAQRTVDAVLDPALTRAQALAIADLPANRGLIAQARDFGTNDTRETFADALLAEAQGHGQQTIFNFAEVRAHAAEVRSAVATLDADPAAFTAWLRDRIAPFAPPGMAPHGIGYLQAGGPGGGFSVDGRVYVNLARANGEMGVTRITLAHEIYHGMQHEAQVAAGTQEDFAYDAKTYAALPDDVARNCYATRQLFGLLMVEATASYVGDDALLPTTGTEALSERKQREASLTGRVGTPITLLEMGIDAITGTNPVSERKVYSMGFLQLGQLYYDIGYVMAKAIAEHDGDAAIGRLVAQPGEAFVRRYIEISAEPGSKLPKLGTNTAFWAQRLACPAD